MDTGIAELILSTVEGCWNWEIETGTFHLDARFWEWIGGCSDGQFSYQRFVNELVHPEDSGHFSKTVEDYLSGKGDTLVVAFRIAPENCATRFVEARGKKVAYNVHGTPARMVGMIVEIKDPGHSPVISDWRLNAALTASEMGLWDWDLRSNAVVWSPETFEIVGLEDFDGRFDSFAKLVHPEDRVHVSETVDRALKEKSAYTDEFRIVRPDGEERWLCNVGRPTFDQHGIPVRLSGTVQDVTARKRDEKTLKSYAQRLIVLEEDLRKTVSIELHDDIGQELSALGFNLAYISRHLPDAVDDKLRLTLEDSRLLTKEINRTVRDLMVKLHPLQLEEYGLIGAIEAYAHRFAQKAGLILTLRLSPDLPRLPADVELALFRITQEALSNVLKYAAATKIGIYLEDNDSLVHLSIVDDGQGFKPNGASLQPTGSGWGLTIMRQRAELAGGSFRLETELGAGTTIVVEVDVARLDAVTEAAPGAS